MIDTIHVDAKEPSVARLLPSYNGREAKIRPDLEEGKPFQFQGNYWSGGSRNDYFIVEVVSGKRIALPGINPLAQLDGSAIIPRGFVVVEKSVFCGKHMPPTIHAHPKDITHALPAPKEITEEEARCLCATASLKNSYGGETGIRQKQSGLSLEVWNETKETCIGKGWMKKNGAITREGRNAVEGHPLRHRIC